MYVRCTAALAFGAKESSLANNVFTLVNLGVVLFVICAGSIKGTYLSEIILGLIIQRLKDILYYFIFTSEPPPSVYLSDSSNLNYYLFSRGESAVLDYCSVSIFFGK